MGASGGAGRVRAGAVLGVWGALSLLVVLLAHEWLSFGPSGHDLIAAASAPCPEVPCVTLGTIITAQIAKALGAAMLFWGSERSGSAGRCVGLLRPRFGWQNIFGRLSASPQATAALFAMIGAGGNPSWC